LTGFMKGCFPPFYPVLIKSCSIQAIFRPITPAPFSKVTATEDLLSFLSWLGFTRLPPSFAFAIPPLFFPFSNLFFFHTPLLPPFQPNVFQLHGVLQATATVSVGLVPPQGSHTLKTGPFVCFVCYTLSSFRQRRRYNSRPPRLASPKNFLKGPRAFSPLPARPRTTDNGWSCSFLGNLIFIPTLSYVAQVLMWVCSTSPYMDVTEFTSLSYASISFA